ncbi:FAD-binding monooxygenase [Flavobacterium jejuense]|uniref:FAD-binding monooxygenase n=1 Tax=Flavobacterium jejuense TaxID=1544455 RepID=A0ABX0ITX8_9FLAO|nr:FAD-dependent monooxygenase [Flavobacterium jejuense]NHN25269.1 FAD-binding monooxygenase [Flavobacterium jejuense]
MKKKSVLISGASIAGLTMAYWMKRYGYKVTVVEIGVAPRMGGSPIDVRGDSLDTAKRMGIFDAIKAARLTMGLEFLNGKGEVEGKIKVNELGAIRPGEDTEIRRDDLVNILYSTVKEGVEYKFSNRITLLNQDEEKVEVTFKDGTSETYDFVFGADGIHSGVRNLVFGKEEQYSHFLNFYYTGFPVDVSLGKKNYGQVYTTTKGFAVIYHYSDVFADGFIAFKSSENISFDYKDTEAQKQIVLDNFKETGWKVTELKEALVKANHFYFDQGCQIKMETWTNGRVALIGDAGYAPAFPTGMGSTLAMQGATTLADALAENEDYKIAFQKYNEMFRPTVDALQATVYNGLSFLLPETQETIDARNKGMK